MTVREALRQAALQISRRDSEVLLAHTLGRDRAWLRAHDGESVPAAVIDAFVDRVRDRAAHRPLQYILGQQEFYGLTLQISADTLIPRPETELLVESVLLWAQQQAPGPLRVADVGTGSGAIALALAAHLPQATVYALDLSVAVRPIVEANAQRLALADRVHFLHADLLHPFPAHPAAEAQVRVPLADLDAVVSNPPYIPDGDAAGLQPEVRDFEPHTALFAGPDGLRIYRRLIPEALHALRPGGLLALEFGFGQREALARLLEGWAEVSFLDDLAGIPRVALARRP